MRKTPTIAEIRDIVAQNPRYYYRDLKRDHPEFYADLLRTGLPIAQAVFCHLQGLSQPPACLGCGGRTRFQTLALGYFRFCSNKCAANAPLTRDRFAATSLDRYGASNPRQNAEVHEKFVQTMRDRYGVDHPSSDPQLHARGVERSRSGAPEAAEKRRQTNLSRYGVGAPAQNDAILARQRSAMIAKHGVPTKLGTPDVVAATRAARRRSFLDGLPQRIASSEPLFSEFSGINRDGKPIPYPFRCHACATEFDDHLDDGRQPRCPVCADGDSVGEHALRLFLRDLVPHEPVRYVVRDLIGPREVDIYFPDRRLAFEYHGLYWHCDHKVHPRYHLEKHEACRAQGVHLVQIFENEWMGKRPQVEGRLRSLFGLNARVGARSCRVARVAPSLASGFLATHHIQGACPASIAYALFQGDAIEAVMTFGRARFGAKADIELLRFASALGRTVVGGASRLLSAFEADHPGTRLVSYSDRRWNRGRLYPSLGFVQERTSTPNYFYSRDRVTLQSRHAFQKHKLDKVLPIFDRSLSESANMYANGYIRIWDCGNDVFFKDVR